MEIKKIGTVEKGASILFDSHDEYYITCENWWLLEEGFAFKFGMCPLRERQTDGQTDGERSPYSSPIPFAFRWSLLSHTSLQSFPFSGWPADFVFVLVLHNVSQANLRAFSSNF